MPNYYKISAVGTSTIVKSLNLSLINCKSNIAIYDLYLLDVMYMYNLIFLKYTSI